MTDARPIIFEWDGEAMKPSTPYQSNLADEAFVIGQKYPLVEYQDRSDATHGHYFATLHDMWMSLPDHLAKEFPTETHMRKHALIATGFCDKQSIVCASEAEARRLMVFIGQMDAYAVMTVDGATVTRWTAHTQKRRAMDAKTFQRSKEAVLTWVADQLGLDENARERRA